MPTGHYKKHIANGTGEIVTEEPPTPAECLDNGEPKPIVTLIDFPQMVRTQHRNAKELYERDVTCLKQFFVRKLKCVPENWDELIPAWPANYNQEECIASKAQVRLDQELQAGGFLAARCQP